MTVETQDDGIARLWAVLYGEDGVAVETTAKGDPPEEIQIGALGLKADRTRALVRGDRSPPPQLRGGPLCRA